MAPVRNQYFYNVVFLIACSITLYLISNQVLFTTDNTTFTSTAYPPRQSSRHGLHYNDYKDQDINKWGDTGEVKTKTSVKSSSSVVSTSITVSKDTNNLSEDSEENSENERPDWLKIFSETAQQVYQMVSEDYLSGFRLWAIDKQRELLQTELKDFKPVEKQKLQDLIMEKGGQPIRNIVFTTWRSGSTFLGDIMEHHPGTYYHYEPFLHFDIVQVRSGQLAEEALRVMKDMLNCRFNNLTDYIEYSKTHHWVYNHNSRVWQYCEKRYEVCWDPHFLSSMCKMFPYQSAKTVRLRLKFAKTLLDDHRLNLRILLLVRDPRGTIQSRSHVDWCTKPDCYDPKMLCSDLVEDYYEAKLLYKAYPGRFMALRYEDISLNPLSATKKLFKFFRLRYSEEVKDFVRLHTMNDASHNPFSTIRNSKTTPFHWKTDFSNNFTSVEKIQTACSKAMKLWGYIPAPGESSLATLDPVAKPPWKEMIIPKDSI